MSEPGHKRAHRVAQIVHHALSELTIEGLKDPRVGFVTITEVRVTDDMRKADVFVSVLASQEDREASLAGLRAAAGFLGHAITKRTLLRHAPSLIFYLDTSLDHAQRLETLFKAAAHGDVEAPDDSDLSAIQEAPISTSRTDQEQARSKAEHLQELAQAKLQAARATCKKGRHKTTRPVHARKRAR